jgi:broad specificity phosphatase PhoE
MANNTFIFLRHAKTIKDPALPVVDWDLEVASKEKIKDLLKDSLLKKIDLIYTSTEDKAIKTAAPFIDKFKLKRNSSSGLNEIGRGKGGMLSDVEFKELKLKMFKDVLYAPVGWESSNRALSRFKSTVEEIDDYYEGKNILIVSHGTVLTLYFSDLLGKMENSMKRWEEIEFCAFGMVKNNKVIKDIVS